MGTPVAAPTGYYGVPLPPEAETEAGSVESEPLWTAQDSKFILALEQATGVFYMSGEAEPDGGPKTDFKNTQVSFLFGSSIATDGQFGINPFGTPRVSMHGVVARGVTLGGAIGFFRTAGNIDVGGGREERIYSGFAVAPRIGYIISPSSVASVWLRGGITHASVSFKLDSGSDSIEGTAKVTTLTLDPQLILSPVPHVGILLGISVDPSIAGSEEAEINQTGFNGAQRADLSAVSVGLSAGLAALF